MLLMTHHRRLWLLLLLHHRPRLNLLIVGGWQLARGHRDLTLQQILYSSGHRGPHPCLQLWPQTLGGDHGAGRGQSLGRAGLDLHHPGQGGGGHRLGGQLGHGRHVAGQALGQARSRI